MYYVSLHAVTRRTEMASRARVTGFDKHITRKRFILPWPRATTFISANSLFIPADAADAKCMYVSLTPHAVAARFRAPLTDNGHSLRGKREIDSSLDLYKTIVEKICDPIKICIGTTHRMFFYQTRTNLSHSVCKLRPAL